MDGDLGYIEKEAQNIDSILDMMNELKVMLNNDYEHPESCEKVKELWREIQDIQRNQQDQLKNNFEKWQEIEEDVRTKVGSQTQAIQISQEELKLQQQLQEAEDNYQDAKNDNINLEQKLAQYKQKEQELLEQQQQAHTDATKSLPLAKNALNFYTNITNIRLQVDTPSGELKGFVCNKKDVQPFNLNTKKVSKFYTANHLWDLIEEDW